MKKERNSNIELLRIISMLLIILYHIIRRYSDYEGNFQTLNTNTYLTETILGIWGLFGVYLFVAISAWFLCSSKFRIKHIISILFQTLCYNVAFQVIAAVINHKDIASSIKYVLLNIHDTYVFQNAHWFVAPYIMMCFVSPFLNILIGKFSKKQSETFLIVLTGVFVYAQFGGLHLTQSGMFLYIYLVCAYLKKNSYGKQRCFPYALTLVSIIAAFCILKDNCGSSGLIGFVNNYTSRTLGNFGGTSLSVAYAAIFVLFGTANIKERNNKLMNAVGGLTFGVYLFHETYMVINNECFALIDVLRKFFESITWIDSESQWYFVQLIILATGTFIAGTAVEFIRKKIIHEPFMRIVDRFDFSKFDRWINMDEH